MLEGYSNLVIQPAQIQERLIPNLNNKLQSSFSFLFLLVLHIAPASYVHGQPSELFSSLRSVIPLTFFLIGADLLIRNVDNLLLRISNFQTELDS